MMGIKRGSTTSASPLRLRQTRHQGSTLIYCLILGVLPILPLAIGGHTVLIQDMLVAYYCYFDDFHRQWALNHWPLWSSSYQTGMPMHAYWQSGWLYPLTWLCFGPLSTQVGLYVFYALHFAIAAFGFTVLAPHLRLTREAALWAGTVFALSGTLLARYEHPTFMAGWAYMPWVLGLYLTALTANYTPHQHRNVRWHVHSRWPSLPFVRFALVFLMQSLGGHPQATITTVVLLLPFSLPLHFVPYVSSRMGSHWGWLRLRRALWALSMALVLGLPLFLPFYSLKESTSRYGGQAWQAGQVGHAWQTEAHNEGGDAGIEGRGVEGEDSTLTSQQPTSAFDYREFTAGSLRPAHLLALVYPFALGTPAHASWWGKQPWTEVYLGLGGLGLLLLAFASWRRATPELRLLGVTGMMGLWLAFGPLFGASQILFHLPVLGELRRPARWDILFVLALAAFSGQGFRNLWSHVLSRGHGVGDDEGVASKGLEKARLQGRIQGWLVGRLTQPRLWIYLALVHAVMAPVFDWLSRDASPWRTLLTALDRTGGKDYVPKLMTLAGDLRGDFAYMALACVALSAFLALPSRWWQSPVIKQFAFAVLFALLVASLVRLHSLHFHRFPADFYSKAPATLEFLDLSTQPFWRITHYLEYPGDSLWRMHHDPLRSLDLYDREKNALAYGLHAVYGIRHVGAHLPLLWSFDPPQKAAQLSARYLLSDLAFDSYEGIGLKRLGTREGMHVYEMREYAPRLQHIPTRPREPLSGNPGQCAEGFSRWQNLCAREMRDGHLVIQGLPPKDAGRKRDWLFQAGDILVFREHAFAGGWEARLDGGEWRQLIRDPLGFQFVNIYRNTAQIEIRYFPRAWFWLIAWALLCFLLLATLCHFYNRKRDLSATHPS